MRTATRLNALDFSTQGKALQQTRRTLTVGELLEEERSVQPRHRKSHVRLLAPQDLLPENESFILHMTRALSDAFQEINKNPYDATYQFALKHFYLIVGHGTANRLNSVSLEESLDGWLRNPRKGEVLIDFSGSNLHDLKEMWQDYFIDHVTPASKSRVLVRKTFAEPREPARSLPRQRVAPDVGERAVPSQDHSSAVVQLEQDAAAWRAELANTWPTAAEVSRQLGSTASNASQLATKLRRAGKLLAVYLPVPGGSWRFPSWQFRPDGQPVARWDDILRTLQDQGPFLDTQRRTTGWGEVEWFLAGHTLLGGLSPAEVLATDPSRVLAAAEAEFGGDV
ncbi:MULTISPECIES: hypothetical protein [Stenotrophomonas]|uniref:hypothetical protein n=1 Tax=Stenotrophomonas TaxID=40323 RepID=UPI001F5C9536|nr:hypothetical protein [[Pseudomonas] hibiscicola]